MSSHRTRGPEETRRLAARLAAALRPRDLLCLLGPMGSGKTTFVQGLTDGLGCRTRAVSPTFGLAREYKGRRLRLHHLDLYRLEPEALANVGLEEYLDDPGAAVAVEWPAAGEGFLPPERLEVRLEHLPDGRRISLRGRGARGRRLAAALARRRAAKGRARLKAAGGRGILKA